MKYTYTETVAAMFLCCWFLLCLPTSCATTSITIIHDDNSTDHCFSNSSGIFCYSLSYVLNHVITDNTTVFIASPEVGIFENKSAISVTNLTNISIHGQGMHETVICYYTNNSGINFLNINGLALVNLTIKLCDSGMVQIDHWSISKSRNELNLYMSNCSDVTIDHIIIKGLPQGGLVMYCPRYYTRILHSIFQENHSSRGGVAVFSCKMYPSSIEFDNCTFHSNRNNYKKPKAWHGKGTGHGGGLLLKFHRAYNKNASILNCYFINNTAAWGGGLFVGYRTKAKNNTLTIRNTQFVNNTATHFGGGGMDIGFYEFIRNHVSSNTVLVENVNFINNSAKYGGGTTVFSDVEKYGCKVNGLTFKSCRWENNTANFSTAVDMSPNVYDNVPGGFPLKTTFENCTFTDNSVWMDAFKKNLHAKSGTVMITALDVVFSKETVFENNVGTALYAVATKVHFESESTVVFNNNSGSNGGAITLVGMAVLQFESNSTFLFQNNRAEFVGGAIYWYSVDQHNYFSSRTCFLHKNSVHTKNVTFTFRNNTAHSNIGKSIYASTLLPCKHSCKHFHYNATYMEIFNATCIANFNFDDDDNPQNKMVATSGRKIFMNPADAQTVGTHTLMVKPGITVQLNTTVFDEVYNNVTSISVFQNTILPRGNFTMNLVPSYEHTSLSDVIILGNPGSTGQLLVQTNSAEGIATVIDIEMDNCPPGFVLKKQKCECQRDEYYGIDCQSSGAYIREGYWVGYWPVNNETSINPTNLWTTSCPLSYCNYSSVKHPSKKSKKMFLLPNTANATVLDEFICGPYRTGIVCGQCRKEFSVFFNSKLHKCKQNSNLCYFGILFYFLSELIPLTLLFIVILFCNVTFTSGAVNGFTLFAQIIDLLYIDAHGIITLPDASWLVYTYQVIYGFFNLEFFSGETFSFCLWKGATVLDTLVFKYITTVFAVLLVFALVVLMNYCTCWKICKCFRKQGFGASVIQGLSAFLVMAYSQSARVTFDILQPTYLQDGRCDNFSKKYVVNLDGSMAYFGHQHIYYALPALAFLIFIVILPPSLLLVNPILIKIIALFQTQGFCNTSRSKYWLNSILLIKFKPLFDSFQGCFKDNCRFFSGVYFLYRLILLVVRWASQNLSSFYIITEFFLIIFLVFHSTMQPYQKRWHNALDTMILGNLAIINGLSMFLYFQITSQDDLFISYKFLQFFRLFLIYCPMLYMLTYTIIASFKKYLRKTHISKVTQFLSHFSSPSQGDFEDEMPARLLNNSNSYRAI